MGNTLHITSGDCAGASLAKCGLPGEVFVWHDILYDGPRTPGWPDESTLSARAVFLEQFTAGGLTRERVLKTFREQYRRLADAGVCERIVLWFDACLFDQSMLAHILTCLSHQGILRVELLCVDKFPGIVPFHGIGQLNPDQLASLYDRRRPVTEAQFRFAAVVDKAFAIRDPALLSELAQGADAPLPWIPAAVTRWLQERPDPATGLGRLESLALEAVRAGCETPGAVFASVAAADTPPQFWGDTTLWAKINALADRHPALVRIEGPAKRLPQWESTLDLNSFRINCSPNEPIDRARQTNTAAPGVKTEIQPATVADLPDLIDCVLQFNLLIARLAGKPPKPPEPERYELNLVEAMSDPDKRVLVARRGNDFAGYATGGIIQGQGVIGMVFVQAGRRRSGVGRELITSVLSWLTMRNCVSVEAEVSAQNPASAFFCGLGFRREGRIMRKAPPADSSKRQ